MAHRNAAEEHAGPRVQPAPVRDVAITLGGVIVIGGVIAGIIALLVRVLIH